MTGVRSDPSSSDFGTRHLLRNARSPQALRENPLVRHLVDDGSEMQSVERVRRHVERALAEIVAASAAGNRARAARRKQIVERYELDRETAKCVAADLGLSRRHFYRERDRAIAELAAKLRASAAPAAPRASARDVHDVAIAAAFALQLAGARDEASARLRTIAATAGDDAKRLTALCTLARLMNGSLDHRGARDALGEANRIAREARQNDSSVARATDLITLVDAIPWRDGAPNDAAYPAARRAMLSGLRAPDDLEGLVLQLHVLERLRHADALAARGLAAEANVLLEECKPLLARSDGRFAILALGATTVHASVRLSIDGPSAELASELRSALDSASRHGYFSLAAFAASRLAIVLAAQRDAEARTVGELSLSLAERSSLRRMFVETHVVVAEAMNAIGESSRAMQIARAALRDPSRGERTTLRARLCCAEATFVAGATAAAATAARACRLTAEATGDAIGRGIALSLLSRCAAAQGRRDLAARLMRGALADLRQRPGTLATHLAAASIERIGA